MDAKSIAIDSALVPQNWLDAWLVPPHTPHRRSRSCGGDRKGTVMTRPLVELVEQFCQYQLKQRGKTEGGVQTARWNLEQFLVFVRDRSGKIARLMDLNRATIQGWMDDMAARDLSVSSMRTRQSTLSSFCTWLVKREALPANPVAGMDRPATSDRSAETGPDAKLDGCAHRGGSETATAPGCRNLPDYAVYGDAASFRGDSPSQALGCTMGLATGPRERRTDQRHSFA